MPRIGLYADLTKRFHAVMCNKTVITLDFVPEEQVGGTG